MDRPSGSYIIDNEGKLTPNLNDEAMAARLTADSSQLTPLKPKEVKDNE